MPEEFSGPESPKNLGTGEEINDQNSRGSHGGFVSFRERIGRIGLAVGLGVAGLSLSNIGSLVDDPDTRGAVAATARELLLKWDVERGKMVYETLDRADECFAGGLGRTGLILRCVFGSELELLSLFTKDPDAKSIKNAWREFDRREGAAEMIRSDFEKYIEGSPRIGVYDDQELIDENRTLLEGDLSELERRYGSEAPFNTQEVQKDLDPGYSFYYRDADRQFLVDEVYGYLTESSIDNSKKIALLLAYSRLNLRDDQPIDFEKFSQNADEVLERGVPISIGSRLISQASETISMSDLVDMYFRVCEFHSRMEVDYNTLSEQDSLLGLTIRLAIWEYYFGKSDSVEELLKIDQAKSLEEVYWMAGLVDSLDLDADDIVPLSDRLAKFEEDWGIDTVDLLILSNSKGGEDPRGFIELAPKIFHEPGGLTDADRDRNRNLMALLFALKHGNADPHLENGISWPQALSEVEYIMEFLPPDIFDEDSQGVSVLNLLSYFLEVEKIIFSSKTINGFEDWFEIYGDSFDKYIFQVPDLHTGEPISVLVPLEPCTRRITSMGELKESKPGALAIVLNMMSSDGEDLSRRYRRNGTGVLVAEHDVEEEFPDRDIILMYRDGTIEVMPTCDLGTNEEKILRKLRTKMHLLEAFEPSIMVRDPGKTLLNRGNPDIVNTIETMSFINHYVFVVDDGEKSKLIFAWFSGEQSSESILVDILDTIEILSIEGIVVTHLIVPDLGRSTGIHMSGSGIDANFGTQIYPYDPLGRHNIFVVSE